MKRLIVLLIIAVLVGVAAVATARAAGDVPLPATPKAFKGEQCVEPVGKMRRLHMEYLLHQRDETLRQGIRGKKYSLRACIECHAVPEKPGAVERSVEPFCASCHKYAAVRIDCFECHTAKAEGNGGQALRLPPRHAPAKENRWKAANTQPAELASQIGFYLADKGDMP